MSSQALLISADVELFHRNFVLTGSVGEQETVLRTTARDIKSILQDIAGDSPILSLIEGIFPEEVEFTLLISKTGKNLFSISADFSDKKVNISIVKAEKYTLFSLCINSSVQFANLPLVGEYIPADYGLNTIGFFYVAKNKGVSKLTSSDFSSLSFEPLNNLKNKLTLNEGENVIINYNSGEGDASLSFPGNILEIFSGNQPENRSALHKNDEPETKESAFRITDVGLETDFNENNKLVTVKLSARLSISKFGFEVIGLHTQLDINYYLKVLKKFREDNYDKSQLLSDLFRGASFGIQGLALQYQSPSFSIYGGFYREISATREEYNGLLTLKLQKLELIALASYVKENSYSSLFAFGYLGITIPLHPAFEIKGLALGLGLNREFKMPPIREVENFPLIQIVLNNGPKPGEGIKEIFSKLNYYIPTKEGSYVIMIGLRFQSFKIIDTIALVVLNIENGLVFNMLGLSTMELPEVYKIKFAFSLQADFNSGFVIARGEITEGSYLIFREVRLQGSFVFAMWFGGAYRGDFLFTIGGYHPDFNAPKHYPAAAELYRLGFSLKRGNLSAGLQMYYALTPQAIMFGLIGKLYYVLDLSKSVTIDYWIGSKTFSFTIGVEVEIKLDAHFIIFWKPFSYKADLELLFNVRLYASFWFFSININTSLHAKLSIWGPDLEGIAYLNVAGYNFTVKFGDSGARNSLLTVNEFRKEFIPEDHLKLNISQGKISKVSENPQNADLSETPVVNPQDFVFELSSQIPVTTLYLKDSVTINDTAEFGVTYQRDNSRSFTHNLYIEVIYFSGSGTKIQKNWIIEPVTQNMPKALWSKEPLSQKAALSGDGLMKNLTTGAIIRFPETQSGEKFSGDAITAYDETNYEYHSRKKIKNIQVQNEEISSQIFEALNSNAKVFDHLLSETDWDFSDLLSGSETYSYHQDFEIFTYTIND